MLSPRNRIGQGAPVQNTGVPNSIAEIMIPSTAIKPA